MPRLLYTSRPLVLGLRSKNPSPGNKKWTNSSPCHKHLVAASTKEVTYVADTDWVYSNLLINWVDFSCHLPKHFWQGWARNLWSRLRSSHHQKISELNNLNHRLYFYKNFEMWNHSAVARIIEEVSSSLAFAALLRALCSRKSLGLYSPRQNRIL